MEKTKEIRTILSEARSKMRLKQREVADEAEISLRYYQKLEAGENEPSLDVAKKLSIILKIDPYILLNIQQDNNEKKPEDNKNIPFSKGKLVEILNTQTELINDMNSLVQNQENELTILKSKLEPFEELIEKLEKAPENKKRVLMSGFLDLLDDDDYSDLGIEQDEGDSGAV